MSSRGQTPVCVIPSKGQFALDGRKKLVECMLRRFRYIQIFPQTTANGPNGAISLTQTLDCILLYIYATVGFLWNHKAQNGDRDTPKYHIIIICSKNSGSILFNENLNVSRSSEHPPAKGGKISKRLGGIIGFKDKTFSWH